MALYENKDMLAVLTNLQSLGRVAQVLAYCTYLLHTYPLHFLLYIPTVECQL